MDEGEVGVGDVCHGRHLDELGVLFARSFGPCDEVGVLGGRVVFGDVDE